jgi:hypothetical protein
MTGAAHRQRVVLTKGLYRIAGVVLDLVQVGHQQIYFPALQTRGQFLPGCQHHLQMHAGVRAVQNGQHRGDKRGAGKRTYSHTQLTLLQAARQL